MIKRLTVLVTGMILTALTVTASAQAAMHRWHGRAEAGRIVWTQVLDSNFTTARLVSAGPDGSGFRVLTHPGPKRFDIDVAVSPDGRQVLFERDLPSGRSVLRMVGAGGGRVHIVPVRCTDPCAGLDNPGWTTDGRRIVFTRVMGPFDGPGGAARSAVLYTARPDGSGMRRLSQRGIDGVYEDYHARFDASGRHLIFLRLRNSDGKTAVFWMRRDGSGVHQLTPWRLAADVPDLSLATHGATRNLVVFETFGSGPPRDQSRTSRPSPPPASRWRPASARSATSRITAPARTPALTRRSHRTGSGSPSPRRSSATGSRRWATSGRCGPTAATGARFPARHGSISGPIGAAEAASRRTGWRGRVRCRASQQPCGPPDC
jgi:hypothetical protein